MTRFVTQLEPLICLSDHRASPLAREHEGRERRTLLRKPIISVPLTGTGDGGRGNMSVGKQVGGIFSCSFRFLDLRVFVERDNVSKMKQFYFTKFLSVYDSVPFTTTINHFYVKRVTSFI